MVKNTKHSKNSDSGSGPQGSRPGSLKRNPSITRGSMYFDKNQGGVSPQTNKKGNQQATGPGGNVYQPIPMVPSNSLKNLMNKYGDDDDGFDF